MTDLISPESFACSQCGGEPVRHPWIGQTWLIDDRCEAPKEEFVRIVVKRRGKSVEFACIPSEIEKILPKVRDAILGK